MTVNRKGRLQDKIAIITGASRGIGRATAVAFGREGANVVVNYNQSKTKAEEVVNEIRQHGRSAFAFQADVGSREAVMEMVRKTVDKYGRIDILVNNAGLGLSGGPVLEANMDAFDAMLTTNVKGIIYCTQAVMTHMMKRRDGKIVNISSIAGLGTSVRPGNLFYAGTKGAVNVITKQLALELGPHGIYVNAIAPGLIKTDMPISNRSPEAWEERVKNNIETTMLQRLGMPEDIAYVVVFLASDESNYITAQVISVDGGRMNFITHSL
ncbi:MAG: 3-oxoacyl-ACP reductase FabG [Candidatus Bathyarchaeota archaeon]|nr:MAG: 3-oxoacyl-ACP reductase FabG [Candidatus Bathyarchaeota archaeon]